MEFGEYLEQLKSKNSSYDNWDFRQGLGNLQKQLEILENLNEKLQKNVDNLQVSTNEHPCLSNIQIQKKEMENRDLLEQLENERAKNTQLIMENDELRTRILEMNTENPQPRNKGEYPHKKCQDDIIEDPVAKDADLMIRRKSLKDESKFDGASKQMKSTPSIEQIKDAFESDFYEFQMHGINRELSVAWRRCKKAEETWMHLANQLKNSLAAQEEMEAVLQVEKITLERVKYALEQLKPLVPPEEFKLQPITIKYPHDDEIQGKVKITGSFYNWVKPPREMGLWTDPVSGHRFWTLTLELFPGFYDFKFWINDEWKITNLYGTFFNNFGSENNFIQF